MENAEGPVMVGREAENSLRRLREHGEHPQIRQIPRGQVCMIAGSLQTHCSCLRWTVATGDLCVWRRFIGVGTPRQSRRTIIPSFQYCIRKAAVRLPRSHRAKQSQFAGARMKCKSFAGGLLWRMRVQTGAAKQSQFPTVKGARVPLEKVWLRRPGAVEPRRGDQRKPRKGSELPTCGSFLPPT